MALFAPPLASVAALNTPPPLIETGPVNEFEVAMLNVPVPVLVNPSTPAIEPVPVSEKFTPALLLENESVPGVTVEFSRIVPDGVGVAASLKIAESRLKNRPSLGDALVQFAVTPASQRPDARLPT